MGNLANLFQGRHTAELHKGHRTAEIAVLGANSIKFSMVFLGMRRTILTITASIMGRAGIQSSYLS